MVHVGVAPAGRRLVGNRRGHREAAGRLDDRPPGLELLVGAGVAEAAVGDVDDVFLDLLERVVVVAPGAHDAGGEVLGHAVGDGDQALEQFAAFLGLDIERDAHFAHIVVVERSAQLGAAPVVDIGRHPAQDVPATVVRGVFNPDHFRAERGHELGCAGAGQLTGEIADAQMGERLALDVMGHRPTPPAEVYMAGILGRQDREPLP